MSKRYFFKYRISRSTYLFYIFLALLVTGLNSEDLKAKEEAKTGEKNQQEEILSPEEKRTISVFEAVSPAVVFIKSVALQRDFFSLELYEIPYGAGSGFIWDKQGHIITNFHVVYQASKIEVVLSGGKSYQAQVVGFSADHDLAVLKIEASEENLVPVPRGASKSLCVGQKVMVIGNPFGLDHSLSTGVVSALGRTISSLTGSKIFDVIQTDAAINPGNSGGPVLDSAGRLIGVATAIYSPSGAYAGVGFAIPADIVNRVVPQLISQGKVKRVGLGISLVPDAIRKRFGLEGAMILQVFEGGAADKAGFLPTQRNSFGQIVPGDTITAIEGNKIENNEGVISFLEKGCEKGDSVVIEFIRNNKKMKVKTVLQEL
ncbi:MAG: trypsin-like peptidase domain-containing protein [Candidatus Omnitrophica bacterium]|nr:trypsin-like peptidase domain-containing protein [Candidatus Omnitrophota bacterium]